MAVPSAATALAPNSRWNEAASIALNATMNVSLAAHVT